MPAGAPLTMRREATLVTGGSSGIGAAIVAARRALGEVVVNLDRAEGGGDTRLVDLSDRAGLDAAMALVTRDFTVTRLVNCAGMVRTATLEETDAANIEATMAVNFTAPALILQALLQDMKAAGFGRVVNIASRAALGRPLRTAYAGSKGALISATRVWALELGGHGITVNAIGPGPIETPLYRDANPHERPETQAIRDSIPVGRMGRPQDVAAAADYFLSREAGFVTGQTLYVCGGLSIGGLAV